MASKKTAPSEQSTVKVRIIDFEMSGSDQSLQESLQTIAAAFSRGTQTVQVSRRIASTSTSGMSNAATADSPDDLDDGQDDIILDETKAVATPERRSPPTPRKPTALKVVHDVSFTDASPTLKEFYAEKNPGKVAIQNYLVVAYWYKHYGGIEELTADHFHTAFRHVGFPTPKDARQPMRDLKNSRDGRMMSGSSPNSAVISHLGENIVDAMNKAE
ncbi:hypothetical protein RCH14_003794 [Massilia sp. MP_M2]|uniref:hypothetical protein n=1 Tax=Massilia sp. MP_M2 TaxID=3071713 RepID=UPI00319E8FBC